MGYKVKQYGTGFDILGSKEGLDIGIWKDAMPQTLVFLKPVNHEDFVFCSLSPVKDGKVNPCCGILKPFWMRCMDGEIAEIEESEAQLLLDTKLNKTGSNIHTEAIISKGTGDTEGNPTTDIEFEGCYGWLYGTPETITEREISMFKQGVLAEQERVWDRLADILNEEDLAKIKSEELFNK